MTAQTETVADIFAEIVGEALDGESSIPGPIKTMVKPQLAKATNAMMNNPEGTRAMLMRYLPRLMRAAEIDPAELATD